MTKALTIRIDQTLSTTDHDPVERWDVAVSRYLETRKGGPEGNTAKPYGRTLRAYRDTLTLLNLTKQIAHLHARFRKKAPLHKGVKGREGFRAARRWTRSKAAL